MIVKRAQKIDFKFTHRQKIKVVSLDLLGKVFANFSGLFKLTLSLLFILLDPWVLEQILSCGTLLWIGLQTLDKEISLVFVENSLVLWRVYDTFTVKFNKFAIWRGLSIFPIHRQAISSQDESENA